MPVNHTLQDAKSVKRELADYGRRIMERNLVVGPGGNISARCGDTIYVKPSGFAFDELEPDDYIGVDLRTGEITEGCHRPTSEILMHLKCYLVRDDVRAVVHAHPPLATGIVNGGGRIEAIWPEFVAFIDKLPVIGYVVPGGKELAEEVGREIRESNAVMMVNHGCLTVGRNLKEAFLRAALIEETARCILASYVVGRPRFLSQEEIEGIKRLEVEDYRKALLAGS
ncbi:MAG: class II aldolase/adducin family protein [Firmicutes bacterium]|nr:class II aldolase/adducin family protein [Bacillota bacterium]